jgi:hypothetical protein
MKIASATVAEAGQQRCLVTVHVTLGRTKESMTIVVLVPDEDGKDAIREFGIARAKDLARQFSNLSPE